MEEVFYTFFQDNPDYNAADRAAEISRLYQRQKAIDAFLNGELEADVVLDMLQQHGINAADYASNVGKSLLWI